MLRKLFLTRVQEKLTEHHFFSYEDFELSQSKHESWEGYVVLRITYIHDAVYFYEATFRTDVNKDSDVSARFAHGEIQMEESRDYLHLEYMMSGVYEWTVRVYEELSASPLIRKVEENQKQLEQLGDVIDNLSEEYFTRNDAEHLVRRLEELEKLYTEKMVNSEAHIEKVQIKLEQYSADIEVLKEQVFVLTQKSWFKKFVTKTIDWGVTHPESVRSIANLTKNLLTDGSQGQVNTGEVINAILEEHTN